MTPVTFHPVSMPERAARIRVNPTFAAALARARASERAAKVARYGEGVRVFSKENRRFLILACVIVIIILATMHYTTKLILTGNAVSVGIIGGLAGLYLMQIIAMWRAEQNTQAAMIDRQQIRDQVVETKQHAADAAAKVNGVTENAMDELRQKHIMDMAALKHQCEAEWAAALAAVRAEHQRERHDLKGQINAANLRAAQAEGEAKALREHIANLECKGQGCDSLDSGDKGE